MRAVCNHIETAILRAVTSAAGLSDADRQKPIMVIENIRSSDWASATFVGASHAFDLRFEGGLTMVDSAITTLEVGLPECDIALAGHIVAEISTLPGATHSIGDNMVSKPLTVNALTIRD